MALAARHPLRLNDPDGSQAPPRVVVVDEEFPSPPNSGKRLRTWNLVTRLAPEFAITYVAHANPDPEECEQAIGRLQALGIRTLSVPRKRAPRHGPGLAAKLASNLFSSDPYSVASHRTYAMENQLKQLLRGADVDLWHVEWTPYASYFRNIPAEPLVIAAHNVESLIWQRYAEAERSLPRRAYLRLQERRFARFERWAFSRAAATIAVSEVDADLARRRFGADRVSVVENGVEGGAYRGDGSPRDPFRMAFVGSLDWRPNVDGLTHFLQTAFPQIVAAEPRTRFHIVGRKPVRALVDLAARWPQVTIHADVPNVIPHLSQAGMLVVPLRIGGGSRLKIIEAAANGLPVVSTRIGAEGLAFSDPQHLLLVDQIEQLAAPTLTVQRSFGAALMRARHAAEVVAAMYEWQALAAKQASVWRAVLAAKASSPARN
jgi:glycosyltransferase involved in cell wall biosynthesis